MQKYYNITDKIHYYFTLLLMLVIPMHTRLIPIVTVAWIASWIATLNFVRNKPAMQHKGFLIISIVLYLLGVISLLYTDNLKQGLRPVSAQIALAAFPIIFLFEGKSFFRRRQDYLITFLVGVILTSAFLLINAFFNSLVLEDGSWSLKLSIHGDTRHYSFWQLVSEGYTYFSYGYLSFVHHPSYYSMYVTMAFAIAYYTIRRQIYKNRVVRFLVLASLPFLVIMIYLLSSRAGILSFMVVLGWIVFTEIFRAPQVNKRVVTVLAIILVVVAGIFIQSRFERNIKNIYSLMFEHTDILDEEKNDTRILIWHTALKVYRQSPIIGVGYGDAYPLMAEEFRKHYEYDPTENLAAHNQFLQMLVGSGIMGLLILLAYSFYGLYHGRQNNLWFIFMLIMLTNFLFESMLERIAGVIFFAFFYNLFVFSQPEHQVNPNESGDNN